MSIRAEAYESIRTINLPDILDPADVPTLIADLEHVIGLLDNFRYMRDVKAIRRMMFEIAHLSMYGMKKFGVAWRDAQDKDVAYPENQSFTPPKDDNDWARTLVAVNCERDYQNKLGSDRIGKDAGNTIDKNPLSVGASFVMLEHYIVNARTDCTMEPGDESALHCIRKIAAIAIRDLETHGLPIYIDHDRNRTSE